MEAIYITLIVIGILAVFVPISIPLIKAFKQLFTEARRGDPEAAGFASMFIGLTLAIIGCLGMAALAQEKSQNNARPDPAPMVESE